MPTDPPTTPNTQIDDLGAYRLEGFIAAGAMGEVWRARHRQLGHAVAIKVITRQYAHEPRFRDGLRREVQAMAGLRHAGIAVILDFGICERADGRFAQGSPYFVMEVAAGGTLAKAISRGLEWSAAKDLLLAMLDALAHAHARGVVHRDLKPDNVLDFSHPGAPARWKLVDFGVAHSMDGEASGRTKDVLGTPGYMAPEQFLNCWRDFGPWTDLYALGCVAHEVICGRRPFAGQSVTALAHQHLEAPLPAFAPRIAVPVGFEAWLNRLLAKSIHARFPVAADARAALEQLGPAVLAGVHPVVDQPESGGATDPMAATANETMAATANATMAADAASMDETWGGPSLSELSLSELSPSGPSLSQVTLARGLGRRPAWTQPRDASHSASHSHASSQPRAAVHTDQTAAIVTRRAGRFAAPPDTFTVWHAAPTDAASDALAAASIPLFGLRATPFVGRMAERTAAWDALQRVRSTGQPEALILQGTAGAGKSRLAEWICHRTAELGAAQVLKATHSRGASSGLGPMLMRHHQCMGLSVPQIRRRTAWLTRMDHSEGDWDLDTLADLMVDRVETRGSTAHTQTADDRFGALRRYLQIIGSERPVLVWLDDAHWSEEAVGLVRFILRWAATERCPVLFLLTVRAEDLAAVPTMRALLDALATLPPVQRMPLAPFAHADMQSLIGGRLTVDADLAHRIARRSHGNPLFVVQLLGEWVAKGVLRATAAGFEVCPGVVPTLPEDLHAVWTDRVEHLLADRSATDRLALKIAAVLGLQVDRAEWSSACAVAGVDAPEALVAVMVEQGLAKWTTEGFAFVHGLLAESLVRQAQDDDWIAINQSCATALRTIGGGRQTQARLGRYRFEAGDLQGALTPLIDAVHQAYRHAEIDEAFDLLDRCDTAIQRLGTPAESAVTAWTLRGRICSHLSRRDAAEQWLGQAREAAEASDLTALYAEALLASALHCRTYHASERAAELAREALQRFEAVGDRSGCGWSRVHLAHVLTNGPEAATTQAHYTAALRDFESLGDRTGMAQCQRGLGWLRQAAGDAKAAADLFALAHANLSAEGHKLLAMAVVNDIADLHRAAGDLDAAEGDYRRVLALFESVGHVNRSVVRLNLGMVELQRGRYAMARHRAEQTLIDAADDPYLSIAAHAQLLVCAAAAGDADAWALHFPTVAEGLDGAPEVELDDALTVDQAATLAHRNGEQAQAVAAAKIGRTLWDRLERPERAAAMAAIVAGSL